MIRIHTWFVFIHDSYLCNSSQLGSRAGVSLVVSHLAWRRRWPIEDSKFLVLPSKRQRPNQITYETKIERFGGFSEFGMGIFVRRRRLHSHLTWPTGRRSLYGIEIVFFAWSTSNWGGTLGTPRSTNVTWWHPVLSCVVSDSVYGFRW